MRILWLNAGLLLPLDKGGKLRTWHLMRHLARRHDITYLSFADSATSDDDRAGMKAVCARLETVPRSEPPKGSLRFQFDAARYLFHRLPYAVAKYQSPAFTARVDHLLQTSRFDLLVCDFLFPAVNVPARLPCRSVIFTHNVEAEIWRRHAQNRQGVSRRLFTTQYERMLRYERSALRSFDLVLAVSEADARTLTTTYGLCPLPFVIPTGVDTTYFAPRPAVASTASSRHGLRLVFTGSMDWLPNEDAMLYFCRDILPLVRRLQPEATLSIVGRAPTPAVRRLAQEHGVSVTGRVDDVRPHIEAADVYVVPLRIGGGTRLKIFEAMAMGKAVVSTTIGAEGLPVIPGRHIEIADDTQAFADVVVDLFQNDSRRRALESAARRLVVEEYDWSAVAGSLERALASLLTAQAVPSPLARPLAAAR
jgi:sugar transferase (PEP-CTERM/EpsH1 system associated)